MKLIHEIIKYIIIIIIVIFVVGLIGVIRKGRISLDDFRKPTISKEGFSSKSLNIIQSPYPDGTKGIEDPYIKIINADAPKKDSEYEFKKKTYDKLKKKLYVSPAFRPNNTCDIMFGYPIQDGTTQTVSGTWDTISKPIDYKELRKRTTGLYTDIGLAQPGKKYDYGPLGYNNEDANVMDNLGNCNCLVDVKPKDKPWFEVNKPKLVEGYTNINGNVSPAGYSYEGPMPTTDNIIDAILPTQAEIQEAISHKLQKASEEAVAEALLESEQMALAKAQAIADSIEVSDSSCPSCFPVEEHSHTGDGTVTD